MIAGGGTDSAPVELGRAKADGPHMSRIDRKRESA